MIRSPGVAPSVPPACAKAACANTVVPDATVAGIGNAMAPVAETGTATGALTSSRPCEASTAISEREDRELAKIEKELMGDKAKEPVEAGIEPEPEPEPPAEEEPATEDEEPEEEEDDVVYE